MSNPKCGPMRQTCPTPAMCLVGGCGAMRQRYGVPGGRVTADEIAAREAIGKEIDLDVFGKLAEINKISKPKDMKFDGGKFRWELLMEGFPKALKGFAAVLTFGALKYEAHSWRTVDRAYERYRGAMYRHLNAIEAGEVYDPESGLPHWDHVMFGAGACRELDKRIKKERKKGSVDW